MMKDKKINYRVARSESFTKEEIAEIKTVVEKYKTVSAAAQDFKIDRTVLTNILLKGSAHPTSVKKVRTALKKLLTTA